MESAAQNKAALPPGARLKQYEMETVLGVGGFGVTYLARDCDLRAHFAVKEYLPNEFAVREGKTVHPKSAAAEDDYRWGLERFLQEARELAKFKHPNIVRVHQIFEANNTAYMVLDYEDGLNLEEWLRARPGKPAESELRAILNPLLNALHIVHSRDLLHRDIAPDNIIIRASGEPVLLDFGAARADIGARSKSISAVVKAGYSPPEQYSTRGNRGAHSDIYALAAVMYRAVTGAAPPEGSFRGTEIITGSEDPLPPLRAEGYSPQFINAINAGLQINPANRPQTVTELQTILGDSTTYPQTETLRRDMNTGEILPQSSAAMVTPAPAPSKAEESAPAQTKPSFIKAYDLKGGDAFRIYLDKSSGKRVAIKESLWGGGTFALWGIIFLSLILAIVAGNGIVAFAFWPIGVSLWMFINHLKKEAGGYLFGIIVFTTIANAVGDYISFIGVWGKVILIGVWNILVFYPLLRGNLFRCMGVIAKGYEHVGTITARSQSGALTLYQLWQEKEKQSGN